MIAKLKWGTIRSPRCVAMPINTTGRPQIAQCWVADGGESPVGHFPDDVHLRNALVDSLSFLCRCVRVRRLYFHHVFLSLLPASISVLSLPPASVWCFAAELILHLFWVACLRMHWQLHSLQAELDNIRLLAQLQKSQPLGDASNRNVELCLTQGQCDVMWQLASGT